MSDTLTNNALIYAILALDSEIKLQKQYLDSSAINKQDFENETHILNDLEQAFAEFINLYKNRCGREKSMPDINELLNNPL